MPPLMAPSVELNMLASPGEKYVSPLLTLAIGRPSGPSALMLSDVPEPGPLIRCPPMEASRLLCLRDAEALTMNPPGAALM